MTGFSSPPGLYYELGFRWPNDAVLMGSVTADAFGPPETSDEYAGDGPHVGTVPVPTGFEDLVSRRPRPLLVVVDSSGAIRNWRHSQAQPWYSKQLCLVSARTIRGHLDHLRRREVTAVEG